MQAQDIIYAALREINWLKGAGQTASPEVLNDGLLRLNRLVYEWSIKRLNVWGLNYAAWALTAAQQTFTIGTGGHFNGQRPVAIRNANIISVGDNLSNPLTLVSAERFSQETERLQQAGIPEFLYYDAAYPLGTLWLIPTPNAAATLELFTWQVISQFALLTTTFDLPPGYEVAIILNLAVALCAMFGMQPPGSLIATAEESEQSIRALNGPPFAGGAAEIMTTRALQEPQDQPQPPTAPGRQA